MHGLPKDVDLSFFSGQVVTVVEFTLHTLRVTFDENLKVMIESRIRFTAANGRVFEPEKFRDAAPQLLTLLGRAVQEVQSTNDGTLELSFDGGDTLTVFDSKTRYESYQITHGDKQIVV